MRCVEDGRSVRFAAETVQIGNSCRACENSDWRSDMKRRLSPGVGLAALCMVLTPAFAQNTAAQGRQGQAGETGKGRLERWLEALTRYMLCLRRTGAAPIGRTCGPVRTLLSKQRWKNAGGCLPGRPSRNGAIRSLCDTGATACLQAWDGRKIQEPRPLWRVRSGRNSKLDHHASQSTRSHCVDANPWNVDAFWWNIPYGSHDPHRWPSPQKDPDPSFSGDTTAHWEGDTLVVDAIAIDTKLRNVAVGVRRERAAHGSIAIRSM